MVYIILNFIAIVFFIYINKAFEKNPRIDTKNMSELVLSMLVMTVEAILFTFILLFTNRWSVLFSRLMIQLVFFLEGLSFILLSFGLMGIGLKKHGLMFSFIQFMLIIFLGYIVFFKFETLDISVIDGISIGSEYLFSKEVRVFFPWTWVSLYTAFFRDVLPAVGVLMLLILREDNSTQLQKYQGILFMEALVVMWALNYFIKFISQANASFSLLFLYTYLFMFVNLYSAFSKTSVPSGRALFASTLKGIFCYIVPAGVLAYFYQLFQPVNTNFTVGFIGLVAVGAIAGIIFSWKAFDFINFGSRIYNNDYEAEFEKALASVDYSGEMDKVTARMFQVFRNSVECSSMNVYIDGGHGSLIPAYSSNNFSFNYPIKSKMFELLLNEGINVVIQSEIDDRHEFDTVLPEMHMFFDRAKCDALFLLAEGHNILGVITLGRKVSGDHYKEYDKNVFTKLFSYFFVFGYYMRNITNKEVLSVVNREVKMSSQIITSIQENIDHIKSTKMDVGYLMVPAHNIGGEFIDLIRLTDTRHLLVVGDLSGKGIAASMNMVILKSIIRTYLAETHDFKQLVVKVNSFVRESMIKGTIFSGLFALIDFETDTMYYINCGIPALFMYTQVYNNVIEIQGSGSILGFVRDISPYISVKTTKLNRGDIILACTDGLINSHSLRGEKYGKERVVQSIMNNGTYPAQRLAQFTFDDLIKFMSKEMEDDVSLLLFKYKTAQEFASAAEIAASEKEEAEKEVATESEEVSSPEAAVEEPAQETAQEPVQASEEPVHEMTEEERLAAFVAQMEAGEAMAKAEEPAAEVPEEPAASETVVEDDMFNTDLSAKKEEPSGGFDFNPADFGLPDDFQL